MKESVLRIVVFMSLLVMFIIVALTASWTDKAANEQIDNPGSGINESGAYDTSAQCPTNHFSENNKEPESDSISSISIDTDEPELTTVSAHYRVNYHRSDPNDLKVPDAHKDSNARMDSVTRENDHEDASDVVE